MLRDGNDLIKFIQSLKYLLYCFVRYKEEVEMVVYNITLSREVLSSSDPEDDVMEKIRDCSTSIEVIKLVEYYFQLLKEKDRCLDCCSDRLKERLKDRLLIGLKSSQEKSYLEMYRIAEKNIPIILDRLKTEDPICCKLTPKRDIPAILPAPQVSSEEPPLTSPRKLLIVDDSPICRRVATRFVKDMDIEYDTAENGLDAIKKILEKSEAKLDLEQLKDPDEKKLEESLEQVDNPYYDLILMDARMPVLDGPTTTKLLKKAFKDKLEIYACSSEEDITAAFEGSQIDGQFHKPLQKKNIEELIHSPRTFRK